MSEAGLTYDRMDVLFELIFINSVVAKCFSFLEGKEAHGLRRDKNKIK